MIGQHQLELKTLITIKAAYAEELVKMLRQTNTHYKRMPWMCISYEKQLTVCSYSSSQETMLELPKAERYPGNQANATY